MPCTTPEGGATPIGRGVAPPSSVPPPPPPPPPSSYSCPLQGSARSSSLRSACPPGSTAGLGAWRLSHRQAATSLPRSKRFVSPPAALFSVRLTVEPQRACPPSMAPPVAPPAIVSVPPGIVFLRQGCTRQTPKDHVVVRVVPGILDRNILEQTSVRTQDVISPGPRHLSLSLHVPRPSVPTPSSPSRHEMLRHVL